MLKQNIQALVYNLILAQVMMISEFVDSVNSVLRVQEETARVEEVMQRIVGYCGVEVPGEFKEVRALTEWLCYKLARVVSVPSSWYSHTPNWTS